MYNASYVQFSFQGGSRIKIPLELVETIVLIMYLKGFVIFKVSSMKNSLKSPSRGSIWDS